MEIFSFYVGIIWYCFTGVLGINLNRWKWLGIKSVVPMWDYTRTIHAIREIFPMFELTIDGLEQAATHMITK